MTLTVWGLIVYFTFVFSYFLNTLITELPSDDRYQRIKKHFTIKRFISLLYYPLIYLFLSKKKGLSRSIKIRYFFVFILSFVSIVTHFFGYTMLSPVIHFTVVAILTISFFTDLEHQIIPNEMTFGLIFIGLIYSIFSNNIIDSFQGILLTIAVFSIFSLVMLLFGQGHAFGAGDIKLCIGLAAVWGWKVTAITLYFTFLIGGISGFYFLYIRKKDKYSYFAFAPVIILGLIVALIYTDNIFDYYYPWVNNSFEIQRNLSK